MKTLQRFVLLSGMLLTGSYISAQTSETISMGASYGNDIYYSVENGVVRTEANNNWDIAFTTEFFDASIIVNHAKGLELFIASNNTSDWEDIDTNGIFNNALYNSTESWSIGAFNQNAAGQLNFGWGDYNTVTHDVNGTRVFVLRYQDGTLKKIVIDNMMSNGTYNFRIANLDGSSLINGSISKVGNNTKNFIYYDIATATTVDREPVKGTWDLMFTKYFAEILPGTYYSVTGALSAPNVQVAERANVPVVSDDYTGLSFETFLDEVGHDWKSFNMSTFQYDITDSLVYFVQQSDFEVYKLYFTSFAGSSSGDIGVTRGSLLNIGVEENEISVLAYPNPATDFVNIEGDQLIGASIRVLDMTGRVVYSATLESNNTRLATSDWKSGFYAVELQSESGVNVFRIQKL